MAPVRRLALLAAGCAALAVAAAPAGAVVPTDPISRIVGTGTAGGAGDGGPAILAQLNAPQGIATDAAGRIYIADGGNGAVRVVDPDGTIRSTGGPFGEPADVAADAQGDVYVAGASDQVVYRVSPAGTRTPVAGTGTAGYNGDGILATAAQLDDPRGVAVDTDGTIYIAESGGNRVRRVGPDGIIRTVAGTGGIGFSGDGGLAASAELFGPRDVAIVPGGGLVVADSGNNRVRHIDPNGVIRTIAGNDSGSGATCPIAPADAGGTHLDFPQQVAVDAGGNVYIAAQGCVTKVASGLIRRIAGNGTPSDDSGDGGPAVAALARPSGVAVDPGGSLLISAGAGNRVRRVLNVAPSAVFTAATPAPLTLQVDGSGSPSGQANEAIIAWSWSFGDGATATGPAATRVYAAAGAYTVTLTVRDDSGALATSSRVVQVPAAPPPPPVVTVQRATVAGAYRGGRLRASILLTGSTTAAGSVQVTLTRRSGPAVSGLATSAALTLPLPAAGAFTRTRIALPRTLAPGVYAVSVGGAPAGRVTIAAPPQGILRRSFGSAVQNGPRATVLPRTARRMFCTFDFAVLPAKGRARALTTQWRVPGGTLPRVSKPRTRRVSGVIAPAGSRFPSGRYTCVLRSGTVTVGTVAVRVR
ncbi:MAG: PKD domain-containing protein [Thermoleophilia bacterium]